MIVGSILYVADNAQMIHYAFKQLTKRTILIFCTISIFLMVTNMYINLDIPVCFSGASVFPLSTARYT